MIIERNMKKRWEKINRTQWNVLGLGFIIVAFFSFWAQITSLNLALSVDNINEITMLTRNIYYNSGIFYGFLIEVFITLAFISWTKAYLEGKYKARLQIYEEKSRKKSRQL